MSDYLKLAVKHKKRCLAFKEDQYVGCGNPLLENASQNPYSVLDDSSSIDHEASFFPETMFTLNCVPDSALPPMNRVQDDQKVFSQLLSCHIRKLGSSLKCSIFLECSRSCSHNTRTLFDYPNKYRDKCIHRCNRFNKCSKLPNPRMCHFSNSSR
ncbi:uncharacterized protein LOC112190881 [Rosa chinensis]|uniref:uncharacterized protein LOC112190881 n=1 Tax=Rosa chinensis TaxID=74649 RepID=UPI001AD917F8|nr:uncharacterized protein LOC112190881 [Rosa chinensis]